MTSEAVKALNQEVLFHRALARPGVFIDVGAHAGAFTFGLGAVPGLRRVAVEPLPQAFAALTARAKAVGGDVTLVRAALSDHPYVAQLQVPEGAAGPILEWASIAKDFAELQKLHPEIARIRTVDVEVTTLDRLRGELDLTHVTGLKIDAEGAEYEVLRGGRDLLREMRPVLSVELEERHRAGCTFTVPAFLDALGYSCFFQIADEILPFERFDRGIMQRGSSSPLVSLYSDPYVNCFYFLPVEQETTLLALWASGPVS